MDKDSKQNADSMGGGARWIVLLLIVLCPFIGSLGTNIVNVALPSMADGLGVSDSAVAWVVTAYTVVMTASTLLFGRLGDIMGNIKVLRWGMIVFTAASLLCGISQNFAMLIAARILQGLGSGAMFANNHGIITRLYPATVRGRALGVNAAFVALGNLAGPSLGGLILSVSQWPMLFLINVPIGIAIAAAQYFLLPKTWQASGEKLDAAGAGLFAAFISSLFIGLQQLQAWGLFHPVVLTCLSAAVISLAGFIVVQKRSAFPLLDLNIFRNKWFTVSLFCAFTSFVAIGGFNLIFPFYLQQVLHYTPMTAGIFMTIYPLVLVAVSPVSGLMTDRFGAETLTLIGLTLIAAGCFLFTTLSPVSAMALPALYVSLMAFGNGLFQAPNNTLVMSSLPSGKVGVGGSVNALSRNLGSSFGVVLASFLLYSGISAAVGYHVTSFVAGENDAFMYGMRVTFLAIGAICSAGVIVTAVRLKNRRQRRDGS